MWVVLIRLAVLYWLFTGALGLQVPTLVFYCFWLLIAGWVFNWNANLTLIFFGILLVLQLIKGNEPLLNSQKLEDMPEYFYSRGKFEQDLNDELWYSVPERASWKWLTKRINDPEIQTWLKAKNMTERELIEIGRQNTRAYYKDLQHPDEPDYEAPF